MLSHLIFRFMDPHSIIVELYPIIIEETSINDTDLPNPVHHVCEFNGI